MKFMVLEDWQATYAEPIRLKEGDLVYLTSHEDNWDGHIWLWARSEDGLEGWVPDTIVTRTQTGCIANEDFNASELTCRAGQILTGEKETHGWVLCRSREGAVGWVPRQNLAQLPDRDF